MLTPSVRELRRVGGNALECDAGGAREDAEGAPPSAEGAEGDEERNCPSATIPQSEVGLKNEIVSATAG